MPQMKPSMWTMILLLSSMLMMSSMSIIHFQYTPQITTKKSKNIFIEPMKWK